MAQIAELIAPSLEHAGYGVVRVKFMVGSPRTLQIMVEPIEGGVMTVDNCADISRLISAILEVEDPIVGPFVLEVSSPGIDRPLVRPQDFERFSGFEAKIETKHGNQSRKRFRGKLLGLSEGRVMVEVDNGLGDEILDIKYQDIVSAKLVLTEELIAASLKDS